MINTGKHMKHSKKKLKLLKLWNRGLEKFEKTKLGKNIIIYKGGIGKKRKNLL
jgi:hypothetical protein